ncbi:class I SAM-dependent methyltransferase [Candidatus Woesearchaeota archaeon]|nr:class I SAM-dependent methyltransferase [Candidatus Woesearchaeota archaeon]
MALYTFKEDKYSSHMQIGDIIKSLGLKPNSKILDVGCSKGFAAKNLSSMNFDFYGIEMDKKDAKIAKPYYININICDLDLNPPEYKNEFFDAIIMADILEHLRDPLNALNHFRKSLKNGGWVIMSTGNVANLWVRINLLFGKFEYTDKGILDRTHTRLYTLKTFKRLAKDAGLEIKKIAVTPIPLPLVSSLFAKDGILYFLHKISYFLAILHKKLFGYQFILVCSKK